ncbi:MAG: DivIVA domain-containing protein [Ignavibacteriales bacterium]|nr:DivIVA domain-containing protein [Ignavibacteriales bacterium]
MTSLEIRQHQFRKVLRGFESKEVSAFLSQLADEIETLQNENRELKTSLSEAVKELEHFHRLEQTIQQTLIQAQESSNKFLANAKQYETQSKREAEEQAENLIRDAHREVIRLKEEISILQAKQKNIVENLKQFLEKGLELVNKTESAIQSEMPESEMMEEKRKYDAEIDDIVKTLVG